VHPSSTDSADATFFFIADGTATLVPAPTETTESGTGEHTSHRYQTG
jgi:hypothetical protein